MASNSISRSVLLSAVARSLPTRLTARRETWRAAVVLGELRRLSNERRRAPDRDRGASKNSAGDVEGALGELALLWTAERAGRGIRGDVVIEHDLLAPSGAVDTADIRLLLDDRVVALEAKAHGVQQGKTRFLINQRAFQRSCERNACGFVPVLFELGCPNVFVGRVIPLTDVAMWDCGTLGSHRDPAMILDLDVARDHYFAFDGLPDFGPQLVELASLESTRIGVAAALQQGQIPEIRNSGYATVISDLLNFAR